MAVALTKTKQKLERGKVSPDALEAMVREVAESVLRTALDAAPRPVAEEVDERPRSLVEFAERFRVGFVAHELHHVIGDTLDHAFRGDCRFCLRPEAAHTPADGHKYGRLDRIIVETPPQVGKSEILSVMAPAYYLGEHPDRYWVAASYDKTLAERNGRYARDVVESPAFRLHYPLRLDPAKTAAAEWEADGERGGFYGVGVGGGLTGRTGDVMVIDDPIRGRSEADSPAYRKRVWDWWTGTALARINPRTIIVIVMTRWHHDDLVGRIINGFDDRPGDGGTERGGRWRIVKAPAIATDLDDPLGRKVGDPLMGGPAGVRFVSREAALDWWAEVQANAGSRDWAALYQQSPGLDEGALFKASGWGWYDVDRELPRSFAHTIQTFDTAFTEKTMNDACASLTAQIDGDRVFLRDGWRDRVEFPALEAAAVALATKWRPTLISVEAKAAGMPLVQSLRKKIRGLKLWDPEGADKVARAFACQPFFEQHRVLLPYHVLPDGTRESPPWVAELLQETGEFPQAAHDDYVDALTQLLLELAAIERRQQRVRQQARRASNVGIDPRYIDTDTKAAPSPEIVRGSRRW